MRPDDLARAADVIGDGALRWAIAQSRRGAALVNDREAEKIDLPVAAIEQSCEALLVEMLMRLCGCEVGPAAEDCFRLIASSAAEQDVPFSLIVRLMREVQQLWLTEVLLWLNSAGDVDRAAEIVAVVSGVIDEAVTVLVRYYLAEQSQRAETAAGELRSAVDSILRRTHLDDEHRELGVTLAHHHLGVVMWRVGGATGSKLRHVVNELLALMKGATALTVGDGEGRLWVWLSRSRPVSDVELEGIRTFRPKLDGVKAAVGPSADGPLGFRRTHLLALDTAAAMDGPMRTGDVTLWQDIALLALVSTDVERIHWYVEVNLGRLAKDDPTSEEHRRTLLNYLNSGGSVIRAATHQHVHRNTIVYRLHRIDSLLPQRLEDNRLHIHAALELAARYGVR